MTLPVAVALTLVSVVMVAFQPLDFSPVYARAAPADDETVE